MTENNNNSQTFIQNNKNLLIALAAIIVVVLLAVLLPRKDRDAIETPVVEDTTLSESTETVPVTPAAGAYPTGEDAYNDAIAQYEGKSIVIANGCVAEPKTTTIALGEHALLVNASDTAHTFMVGDEQYTVGERHYKTLRLNAAGTVSISCDGQADIASVTVE